MNSKKHTTFDAIFMESERLPTEFTVLFEQVSDEKGGSVQVTWDKKQVGDVINDNSYEPDYYRFHDVFHFTFAALLGWSPCTRSMMKRKRKSNQDVDEIEDGARAAITEEAISLIIFNEAKKKGFFAEDNSVDPLILRFIMDMTSPFEVSIRTEEEWEEAIIKGYQAFNQLVTNGGGKVYFNALTKTVEYLVN